VYEGWRSYRNYVAAVAAAGGVPHRLPDEAEFEEEAIAVEGARRIVAETANALQAN
jgi:hypothetical protein